MFEEEEMRKRAEKRAQRRVNARQELWEFFQVSVISWMLWIVANLIFPVGIVLNIWGGGLALATLGWGIYTVWEFIDAEFLTERREKRYREAFQREMEIERARLHESASEKLKRHPDDYVFTDNFDEKPKRENG